MSPILFFLISSTFIIISANALMKPVCKETKEKINGLNNMVLILLIALISISFSFSGVVIPFRSFGFIFLCLSILVVLSLFIFLEKKQLVGMFPYDKFKDAVFTKSILITMGAAIGKLTILTFAPMYIMLSLQTSVELSGMVLIPMLIVAPFSAYISGRLLLKIPYKWIIGLNIFAISLGLFLFSLITPSSSFCFPIIASIISGLGAGSVGQIILIILQEHYDKSEIGVITSTHTFFRWFGNLVGISIGTFSLMFFSNKIFNQSLESVLTMDDLYKGVFANKQNMSLIVSWNEAFHYIFLISSILLFLVTILAFTIGNGKISRSKT